MKEKDLLRLLFEIKPDQEQTELILEKLSSSGPRLIFENVPENLLNQKTIEHICLHSETYFKKLIFKMLFSEKPIEPGVYPFDNFLSIIEEKNFRLKFKEAHGKEVDESIHNILTEKLGLRGGKKILHTFVRETIVGTEAYANTNHYWKLSNLIFFPEQKPRKTKLGNEIVRQILASIDPEEHFSVIFDKWDIVIEGSIEYIFSVMGVEDQVKMLRNFLDPMYFHENILNEHQVFKNCVDLVYNNIKQLPAEDALPIKFTKILGMLKQDTEYEINLDEYRFVSKDQISLSL